MRTVHRSKLFFTVSGSVSVAVSVVSGFQSRDYCVALVIRAMECPSKYSQKCDLGRSETHLKHPANISLHL